MLSSFFQNSQQEESKEPAQEQQPTLPVIQELDHPVSELDDQSDDNG